VPYTGVGEDRVYKNSGNAPLLSLLSNDCDLILDIGCGAGDNARILKSRDPECQVHGITHSPSEAEIAKNWMTSCWVCDIEGELPPGLSNMKFDAIILSHVLEHLRDPSMILRKFSALLRPGGCALIAVPNALSWAMRWRFIRGDFEYTSDGVLDDTHLRFFTYRTADRYLLDKSLDLRLTVKCVSGSVPQWWLRRYLLPKRWSAAVDALGCRIWPNLFGEQVLLKAQAKPLEGTK
jgi:SAM-dependent methyltransferase